MASCLQPAQAFLAKAFDNAPDQRPVAFNVVVKFRASQVIAGLKIAKRFGVVAKVLKRLRQAKREVYFSVLGKVFFLIQTEHLIDMRVGPVEVFVNAGIGEMRLRVVRLLLHYLLIKRRCFGQFSL